MSEKNVGEYWRRNIKQFIVPLDFREFSSKSLRWLKNQAKRTRDDDARRMAHEMIYNVEKMVANANEPAHNKKF